MGRGACRWQETEISKVGVTQGVVIGGGLGQQQWRPRQGASEFLPQLTAWAVHSCPQPLLAVVCQIFSNCREAVFWKAKCVPTALVPSQSAEFHALLVYWLQRAAPAHHMHTHIWWTLSAEQPCMQPPSDRCTLDESRLSASASRRAVLGLMKP